MTLQEVYSIQNKKEEPKQQQAQIIVSMPEVAGLLKHLDLLYAKLLSNDKEQNTDQPLVEILGKPYIQTRSWYNPGQGIKQSAAVE
tara:strand:+ start:92 stop:349 length:258 start_codon:yes stop_codon:yes gene_type:complete